MPREIRAVSVLRYVFSYPFVLIPLTWQRPPPSQAGLIEQHPERRFKAAFAAYLDREMPILKSEHPGLRKQQMHDMIYKQFQKAPENPYVPLALRLFYLVKNKPID
jgi:hypothetical protein